MVFARCVAAHPDALEPCGTGQAVALLNLKRPGEALEILQGVARPDLARAYYSPAVGWLAHARLDLGQLDEAQLVLETASELAQSEDAKSFISMEEGRLHLLRGNGPAALACVEVAIETRQRPEYELTRALILAWLGRNEESRAAAQSITAELLPPRVQAVPRLLMEALSATGDETRFSQQLRAYPREQAGWFVAALRLYVLGRGAAAHALLAKAREVTLSASLLTPGWVWQDDF